jgi:hypothetical protein
MCVRPRRELSAKIFAGRCRLIEIGYRQGGPVGFGLRRMLLDENDQHKGILAKVSTRASRQTG